MNRCPRNEPLRHASGPAATALCHESTVVIQVEEAGRLLLQIAAAGRRAGDGRRIRDRYGPDTGEVEAAKKRIDAQLAGAAQVHQELHRGVAQLAKLAREFVHRPQFRGIAFARQKRQSLAAEAAEQRFESGGQAPRFLFREYAALLAHSAQRERHAQHLLDFFVGQVAYEVAERREAIDLAEHDVDRQPDPEDLRHLADARMQAARQAGELFVRARLQEHFEIDEHHHAARRLLAFEDPPAQRLQPPYQPHPATRIAQQRPAGFDKHGLLREPDIQRPRRDDVVVLINLSREQIGLHTRMRDHARLGRPAFTQHQEERQLAEPGLFPEVGCREARFGVADEGGDFALGIGRVDLRRVR